MRLPDKTVGHPASTLLSQEWPFPCPSFSLVSFLRELAQKCSHEEPCFCSRPQKHMLGTAGHSPCPDAQTPAAQRYLPSIDSFALCRDVLINTQGTKEYRYVVFILRTSLILSKRHGQYKYPVLQREGQRTNTDVMLRKAIPPVRQGLSLT